MSWTIVTVAYNSSSHLLKYWGRFHELLPGVEWVVVDNASIDGSADLAESLGATVVRLPENRGFAHANNAGLTRVSCSHVMFVNPDIEFPPGADLSVLERWDNALVAPLLLNRDGSVQDNARGLPYLSRKVRNRLGDRVGPHPDYVRRGLEAPTRIAWAMGAALGGRTEIFRAIGGWNDKYFLYYEDHEIGLRAWQNGLEVIYDPSLSMVHEWQRATRSLRATPWAFELRSMATFYRSHPALLSTRLELPPGLARVRDLQWSPVL